MNVRELQQLLSNADPEATVMLVNQEFGCCIEASSATFIPDLPKLLPKTNVWTRYPTPRFASDFPDDCIEARVPVMVID